MCRMRIGKSHHLRSVAVMWQMKIVKFWSLFIVFFLLFRIQLRFAIWLWQRYAPIVRPGAVRWQRRSIRCKQSAEKMKNESLLITGRIIPDNLVLKRFNFHACSMFIRFSRPINYMRTFMHLAVQRLHNLFNSIRFFFRMSTTCFNPHLLCWLVAVGEFIE